MFKLIENNGGFYLMLPYRGEETEPRRYGDVWRYGRDRVHAINNVLDYASTYKNVEERDVELKLKLSEYMLLSSRLLEEGIIYDNRHDRFIICSHGMKIRSFKTLDECYDYTRKINVTQERQFGYII